jgi:HTH-type transcriptional regulator/antitoxin HigA
MDIRPIKTEEDYEWALSEIARYFETQPEVGSAEGDRFDVLSTLVEAYENEHYPIRSLDPVEAIAAHMEMAGLKQVSLAEILGSRSRASEILARRRALTMEMAHRIHEKWHIPAEVLIKPYRLAGEELRRAKARPKAA